MSSGVGKEGGRECSSVPPRFCFFSWSSSPSPGRGRGREPGSGCWWAPASISTRVGTPGWRRRCILSPLPPATTSWPSASERVLRRECGAAWPSFSVAANLSLLCYFKYVNFFLSSLEAALRAAGASTSFPLLKVILPIGVSFYTFEAISYVVDVYRCRIQAERNLANLLLFILFFPHLVAGPIVRARDFLPQIRRTKRWSWLRLQYGVQLFLLGMLKKWALGDRMALYADPIFADPGAYRIGATWLGMIAYALQVYGDFSGYSDMALGAAHMLGYKLCKNFDMPFLSANMSEMWRRWHISLSTWFAGLRVPPARAQQPQRRRRALPAFSQLLVHDADDVALRALARCELGLRRVGCGAWSVSDWPSHLPQFRRTAAASEIRPGDESGHLSAHRRDVFDLVLHEAPLFRATSFAGSMAVMLRTRASTSRQRRSDGGVGADRYARAALPVLASVQDQILEMDGRASARPSTRCWLRDVAVAIAGALPRPPGNRSSISSFNLKCAPRITRARPEAATREPRMALMTLMREAAGRFRAVKPCVYWSLRQAPKSRHQPVERLRLTEIFAAREEIER